MNEGNKKKAVAVLSTLALVTGLLAGCGSDEGQAADGGGVQNVSIAIAQVGDVPSKGNEVQKRLKNTPTPNWTSSGFRRLRIMTKLM